MQRKFTISTLNNDATMPDDIVRKQFDCYRAHQDAFVEKYNGKVIVLVNFEVVGSYENEDDAYWDTVKKYKLGTFCIQLCTSGPDAYTIRAHTHYLIP